MNGFDIDALLQFRPPRFFCERCAALLTEIDRRCPVCGVEYVATKQFPTAAAYLRRRGLELRVENLMEHCRGLAEIAHHMRESLIAPQPYYPPMRALLASFAAAHSFVHFTTYGMSALLLGTLKLAAQRVDVRGVVSGLKHEGMIREIEEYADESPRLNLKIFPQDARYFPHQKIIVIDGLLAFKGSANMTDFGWRKAAVGHEVIEPVTNVNEVVDLHNRFFSPVWSGEAAGERIMMRA